MYVDQYGREHRYAPPQGWLQRDGTESLGPQDWAAQVARGLKFPPYSGTDTHVRIARGTCLFPVVTAGDMLRVRPVAEGELLIDGGLYVIDWANEAEVQTYRDEIRAPRTEQILISKFLKFSGGEWWCMCRDSFARLNGTVVAMVVGVVSTAAGTPEPIHAGQVGANAATDFGSASSASGSQTSVTYSGAPTTIDYTILTLSYTNNTGATQTLEMFASCRFTVSGSGGGWLAAPRVTGTYPQSAVVGRTAASDEGYAYTGSATIANGATATLTLSAEFKNGGTGSNALVFAYTDAALKYNILKR